MFLPFLKYISCYSNADAYLLVFMCAECLIQLFKMATKIQVSKMDLATNLSSV